MEEIDLLELLEKYWHYLYMNGDVDYVWRRKFTLFGFMQWLKSRQTNEATEKEHTHTPQYYSYGQGSEQITGIRCGECGTDLTNFAPHPKK